MVIMLDDMVCDMLVLMPLDILPSIRATLPAVIELEAMAMSGALVIIMEPDMEWLGGIMSSAFAASGSAQSRRARDRLRSVVSIFIWFCWLLFLCWQVCGKISFVPRQPAAGGLQRLKPAAACHPDGKSQTAGYAFRISINNKCPAAAIGLIRERTCDERKRGKIMV